MLFHCLNDIWSSFCVVHVQALYFTGNYNADLAAAWIFENQDKNLDAEFNEVLRYFSFILYIQYLSLFFMQWLEQVCEIFCRCNFKTSVDLGDSFCRCNQNKLRNLGENTPLCAVSFLVSISSAGWAYQISWSNAVCVCVYLSGC